MPDGPAVETPPTVDVAIDAARPRGIRLAMPVSVRGASLALLAVLASLYMLHWASAVFIPVLMSLMFSYALSPAVDRLERWHVPRAIGAALLLLAVLGALGATVYSQADDATAVIESLPEAAQKLRESLRSARGKPQDAIEKVQRAATNLEQAAEESGVAPPPPGKGVTRVQIERPRFNVKDYLWSGTLGLMGFVGQIMVVCFVTYFLLASGDSFRRKMVSIAGPRFAQKRVTIQVLDEITRQIQRYLILQIVVSLIVGLVTWAALAWIGLERAAVWGVLAALLNFVPYLGAIAIAAATALVAFLQFGTLGMALAVVAVSLVIHTISGNLLAPWLTGRASRISPVVIFVSVLAWGWLWGVWGLLLGAPIMMVIKAVCDHVEDLKPAGQLLGD